MSIETEATVGLIAKTISIFKKAPWSAFAKMTVGLLLAFASIGFWENRPLVYHSLAIGQSTTMNGITGPIGDATQEDIRHIVNREPSIAAIQVVSVNASLNTRKGIYFYSHIQDFDEAYNAYQALPKVSESPLFITGDSQNNDRVIGVINQDFVCVDVPDRVKRLVPIAAEKAKTICSLSIPPFYGKGFLGYVNIWLKEAPNRNNLLEYRQIARVISDKVYDRDIMHTIK